MLRFAQQDSGLVGSEILSVEMTVDLLKAVVEDLWDDAGQERAADLKAWIGIDFNQVEAEVFIKHEVVTE